ncbi:DNA repair protein RecO, partial [candidate division TA06 bacterium]|nr:DNA repair protein RecO [candidate division TA06 bacterium]
MPNIVKTEGIVLKRMDFRETSRIVFLYTKKFGKIKVLAKGIRRPKSMFGSSLETLTRSAIVFYKREQKDLYTISESDILDSFEKLRRDLIGYGYASILLDFLDKANPGEGSNPMLYRLTLGTLKAMESCVRMRSVEGKVRNSDPELVSGRNPNPDFQMLLWGYLWRGISFLGFKPELVRCVVCKKEARDPSSVIATPPPAGKAISGLGWSSSLGGILCRDCWGKDEEARKISQETLDFLRLLKNGGAPLPKFHAKETLEVTKDLIKDYLFYHL